MSYEPINWKDRIVEKPRTYNVQNNPDGTITLIPAPGTVIEEGTPVNAANLNKLEQGFSTHLADYVQHGVTMGSENDIYVAKIGSLFESTPLEVNFSGSINAMATDDEFVYVGGGITRTVKKLRKSDLSQVAESASYGGDIEAIAIDDEFVYVGGLTTRTVRVIENRDLIKIIRRYQ